MARAREQLPRLNIPQPLNMQQPMGFGVGQPMYSPALPTAIQQSYHPQFSMNNPMQTPMQTYFNPQPPPAPGRPTHHAGAASIAHLAAAGIHPPNGFPMTPVGGHFSRPSMMLGPGGQPFVGQPLGPPFPNRNRRQLSIGGPPKAVLGGPARKLSPLPTVLAVPAPDAVVTKKAKKIIVNLPKETPLGDNGQPGDRPSWARTPLERPARQLPLRIESVESMTAEAYPPDDWRHQVPKTLDVFLPGKVSDISHQFH